MARTPTTIFSGELGKVQYVTLANGHTWPIPIETIVMGGLLEELQSTLQRIEEVQNEILLEMKKHTAALMEAVERPLEPVE